MKRSVENFIAAVAGSVLAMLFCGVFFAVVKLMQIQAYQEIEAQRMNETQNESIYVEDLTP